MLNKVKIIYEDDDCLVIDKPAGLVVHPDGRTHEQTLVDWILQKYPETKDVGEPLVLSSGEIIYRPGIVHRIDRETSGVLVVAKTQASFLSLKKEFQDHSIEKKYLAFVYGSVKDDYGIIDRPIGKSSKDFRLWSAQRGAKGKMREAVTEFEVLKRSDLFTYIEVKPKTGRTHQIRVHFKAINHPLVCDRLYAPKLEPALGFARLALHAKSLAFRDPEGNVLAFESPIPDDFERALTLL